MLVWSPKICSLISNRKSVAEKTQIRTVDQETAKATGAHLSEGDLFLAGELGHALLKRGRAGRANGPFVGIGRSIRP